MRKILRPSVCLGPYLLHVPDRFLHHLLDLLAISDVDDTSHITR